MTIRSAAELRALYRPANPRSVAKELSRLDRHCRRFLELSPFMIFASAGERGLDASPRGGPPGFVTAPDEATLLVPDYPGNNRLDTLENLLVDPRVGLLFLVPGIDETPRVNGRASIEDDPDLRGRVATGGKPPIAVLKVSVEAAYLHCAKAPMRAALWSREAQVDRAALPSMGEMLRDQVNWPTAETQAEMLERYRATLYQDAARSLRISPATYSESDRPCSTALSAIAIVPVEASCFQDISEMCNRERTDRFSAHQRPAAVSSVSFAATHSPAVPSRRCSRFQKGARVFRKSMM